MERQQYSAGAVKLSFWLSEFRKVVQLLAAGKTMDEIRQMNREENLFGAPTRARADKICNTVLTRVSALDSSFIPVFLDSSLETQKIFALSSLMACDTLFFEFVYEVYREKLIMGDSVLADKDLRVFFANKQREDTTAARWTDATLHRLGACYKTMLFEAGLLEKGRGDRQIRRPLLDPLCKSWMETHGMTACVKAFTGER